MWSNANAPFGADSVAQPRNASDEAGLRAFLGALAEGRPQAASSPTCHLAGRGAAPRLGDQPNQQWVYAELEQCIERGEGGHPESARRAAELFELIENYALARAWWGHAAGLGDPDAIFYVRDIVNG